jgi:hypothetical protein
LILVPTLLALVLDFTGSEASFLLFSGDRPGIFFTLGGNGLGFSDTGHATHVLLVGEHVDMSSCMPQ